MTVIQKYSRYTLCFGILFFTLSLSSVQAQLLTPDQFSEKDQAYFFAEQYWSRFDFNDTNFLHDRDFLRFAVVQYLESIAACELPVIKKSLYKTLKRAEVNSRMYDYFSERLQFYLDDPMSHLRDDEWFEAVLQARLSSPYSNFSDSVRIEHQLKEIEKNRKGTKANNLRYIDIKGDTGHLYEISAEYLLLFLYIPGCVQCGITKDYIIADTSYQYLHSMGRLRVFSLFPEVDIERFHEYAGGIPNSWINAYDAEGQVQEKGLYAMRAAPTIYLLDKEKKVLLKDPSEQRLVEFLKNVKKP